MTSRAIITALALSASMAAVPAIAAVAPSRQPDAAGANGSMAINGSGNNGHSNGQGTMAVNGTGSNGRAHQGTMSESGSGNNGIRRHQGSMAHNGTWNNARAASGRRD